MCGRYTLRTPLTELAKQLEFDLGGVLAVPRFNIAPSQDVLAMRDGRELATFKWGLLPGWAKDAKFAPINARSDTVAVKPTFRTAFRRRRCLMLADGYFEWLRQGKSKKPYLYEVDGGKPFAFAAVWEMWRGPEGDADTPLETCAMVTCDANKLAAEVHDRMPVILDACDYDAWLSPATEPDELLRLLVPFDSDRMSARPVSTTVNNARNEGPECIAEPK
jgi:putative SOS response-associated peptidase YedK